MLFFAIKNESLPVIPASSFIWVKGNIHDFFNKYAIDSACTKYIKFRLYALMVDYLMSMKYVCQVLASTSESEPLYITDYAHLLFIF